MVAVQSGELPRETQVQILLAEYNRLTQEIRLGLDHFLRLLTIAGTILVSAFLLVVGIGTTATAFGPSRFIFVPFPFFLLFLIFYGFSMGHLFIAQVAGIRSIEERIRKLNEGTSLLRWECELVPRLLAPTTYELSSRSGRRIVFVGPHFVTQVFGVGLALAMIAYSVLQAASILPSPWNFAYFIAALLTLALCAYEFFGLLVYREAIERGAEFPDVVGRKKGMAASLRAE